MSGAGPAPQRILSGSLASDEIILELLDRVHGLDRLLAVSTLADDRLYSNIAPVPTAVKGRFAADLEGALALRPDLVILASFNKPETLERFKAAKVQTHVLGNFVALGDVTANITALGELLGTPAAAAALRHETEDAIAAAARKIPPGVTRPTVLDFHPGGTVSGAETLFDAIVAVAGGDNLAAKQGLKGWPAISAETLAGMAPDVIVAAGEEKDRGAVAQLLATTPGWKSMRNAGKARLVLIPERQLSATSHHIVKAIEKLNQGLFSTVPAPNGAPTK